jgi:ribonuclease Y
VESQQLREKLESQDEKRRAAHETALAALQAKEQAANEQLHHVQRQLESIANLTAAEAREQLVESLKNEAQIQASSYIKDTVAQAKLTATKDAKKIVLETIQRTASEHAIENCVSIFNIESDDVKGKIIGREGRNIRALEAPRASKSSSTTPRGHHHFGLRPGAPRNRSSLAALAGERRPHSPGPVEEIVAKTRKNIERKSLKSARRPSSTSAFTACTRAD